MLKIITLIGTRPEIIKLSRVIANLDVHTEHVIVHTGQNYDYELNEVFFDDLGIRTPDHFLEAADDNAAQTIANVISAFDAVLASTSPDAVLILGDTNSCLGIIAAKKRKIPIFHMEAGNRCFDERVPEESNRRVVDHISDVNLVYTEHARDYLLNEGFAPDRIIKTGSPMREVLEHNKGSIEQSDVLKRLSLKPESFVLASSHREENVDDPIRLERLLDAMQDVAEAFDKEIVFSAHPRTRRRCSEFGLSIPRRVNFVEPLGFLDYCKLQVSAFSVVSDSGTLTEEAAILGFPAVMIREAHERPEGMDEGIAVMAGLTSERIIDSVRLVSSQGFKARPPGDYGSANVADKVVRIIVSYTDFVRRVVWRDY